MSQNEQEHETSAEQTVLTKNRERSIAEWTTLAISAAILLGIVGLISWLHFSGEGRAAVIVVEPQTDQIRQDESGYYLPVIVRNDGDETAEDVEIQAELVTGSGEPETADFLITFLVGGEKANGTFIFQSDPSQGELTTAAASYKLP